MMKLDRNEIERVGALLVYMLSNIEYTDELFSLLFVDVGNNAACRTSGHTVCR